MGAQWVVQGWFGGSSILDRRVLAFGSEGGSMGGSGVVRRVTSRLKVILTLVFSLEATHFNSK